VGKKKLPNSLSKLGDLGRELGSSLFGFPNLLGKLGDSLLDLCISGRKIGASSGKTHKWRRKICR